MTPFVPWQIWRRISGEPSELVAIVQARTEREALSMHMRRVVWPAEGAEYFAKRELGRCPECDHEGPLETPCVNIYCPLKD